LHQDGTLTDSIAAVEAAWGKVAADIGQDPAYVVAATHGKRAIDNLAQFKPHLQAHEVEAEVDAFEKTILYYADAFMTQGRSPESSTTSSMSDLSATSSGLITPALSIGSSVLSTQSGLADVVSVDHRRSCLSDVLTQTLSSTLAVIDDGIMENGQKDICHTGADMSQQFKEDVVAAWQVEAAGVDRSVRILPSVKEMIASIPDGRYAVATSGAKTYGVSTCRRVLCAFPDHSLSLIQRTAV
jgi:hypothetical protein